jgi:hypothetical protein
LVSDTQGQLIQDQPVSRVPSHETRKAKTSDQSNADKWTHTHDPLAPVNQQHSGSHSNIQVVRQIVSDTDKWGPAHDPWSSETPSGRLPGSHSRVSHNVTSNTYASDARDNLWQARHDPWLAEQPVTSDLTSRKYHHKHAPSVVQHMYPAHNSSQPIASISSQSGRSRDVNAGLRANGLDPHRFVRQQQVVGINDVARQYLGNECECERRFSSAETGGTGQTVLGSTPSEEPRSMSSPPRIVACLDDKERLHMIGAGSATEWHRARPPTPAMVSTRPFELGELQLKTAPSTKSGNTGDAHFRKVHHSASSVDFNSERDPRISKTMIVEPGNLISHVGSREDQVICQPDVHRLIGDVTRDAVPQCINSLHSNANVNLSSIPLALMPQNDLASHTLQNSISSNVHLSESCPGAEKAAHSQTGFDPRAEGWLTNFGSGGRKPVGEPYDASPSRPRHSLQPGSSSVYAYGNRDGQQRGTDPRKRPSPLADAHRYAYGTRPRGDSGGNNLRS